MLHRLSRVAFLIVAAAPLAAQAPSDSIVSSTNGMVISTSAPASDVGAAILKKGGNAIDAAVATAFALAVTHPSAGNIGGGGFMVIRPAKGAPITIAYRQRSPLKSTETMYLDSTGKIVRPRTPTGHLPPGVPGPCRRRPLAHKKSGKLPWKNVVMPRGSRRTGVCAGDASRSRSTASSREI